MKGFTLTLFVFAVAAFVCSNSTLDAQTVQGVVTGTVVDSTGAVIPAADLSLTNDGTGVSQEEKSHQDGSFRFPLVPPGTYTLTTKAGGFTTRQIKNIVVDASQTVPVSVTMSVATTQTTVEVSAQESLVQTATSDLATTISQRTIESMPLLTRNVFDLAFAAPAVTQGMNFNATSGGARESGTTFMLNGADNNDNFSEGGVNIQPALESVAEFTMLTNNMSAQYGHASGALVSAVQKSGTNGFHGVAYEFNRNASFNASDFFANRAASPKPKYIRNQFGGEVDGPIVKNKTFFSFTYDRLDLRQGTTYVTAVPTPDELTAMSTNAGPLAQQYLQAWAPKTSTTPCPAQAENFPDSIGHIGCVSVASPQPTKQNVYAGKVDQNFGSHDRLSFTANFTWYNYTDQFGGGYNPGGSGTAIPYLDNEHYWNMSLVETHLFNASLLNELTIAHNRHYSVTQDGDGHQPQASFQIDGANYDGQVLGYGAVEGGQISGFVQDRWQFQDNLGWTKGKHSFKFGGGMQYGILYRNWDLGSPGYYEFANTTGPSPADTGNLNPDGTIGNFPNYTDSNFQKDFPYYSEVSVDPHTGAPGNAYRHYIMKDINVFVNDDWKVTRRLTLNLGLRWERYGAPTESNNIIAQFTNLHGYDPASVAAAVVTPVTSMWNTANKDFGPRFGFAYDVLGDGRMSVRGGYGISYDRLFDNIWSNGAWNPPFYALVDHDATGGDNVSYTIPPGVGGTYIPDSLPGSAGRVSVRTMDVNMKDSSTQNFYLGVERQFWHDFLLRVNYQGAMGHHLSQLMNLNRYDGLYYSPNLTGARPNSLYTGFNYRANNLNSNYNSMVSEVQKRFSHGMQFQFSFTWSRLMDQGSDLFSGSTTSGGYSQPFYFISNDKPGLEYGPGAFDHQKNFKTIFTYEVPFLKDQKGFVGHVLGGWQISGFYQGYSGHPIEVYSARNRYKGNVKDANGNLENLGGDYNLDGVLNDHPDFVGSSASAVYSGFSPADGIFTDNNPIGCGFPGAQSTNIAKCNSANGVSTPNTLFMNPAGTGLRYGTLGRNLFRGPWFNGLDGAVMKNFRITEAVKAQFRFEALNLINHPNFDGIQSNLNSGNFGKAQILIGNAISRRLQLGLRIMF
jgi:hypothetical protein